MNLVKPSVVIMAAAFNSRLLLMLRQIMTKNYKTCLTHLRFTPKRAFGITDKGANIKIGQTYQSSQPGTMAMNIIEMKGIGGEPRMHNDSHPNVNYDVDNDKLDASTALFKAYLSLVCCSYFLWLVRVSLLLMILVVMTKVMKFQVFSPLSVCTQN